MNTRNQSAPNRLPAEPLARFGSRRHFPAVSARVRASLVLRRLELGDRTPRPVTKAEIARPAHLHVPGGPSDDRRAA